MVRQWNGRENWERGTSPSLNQASERAASKAYIIPFHLFEANSLPMAVARLEGTVNHDARRGPWDAPTQSKESRRSSLHIGGRLCPSPSTGNRTERRSGRLTMEEIVQEKRKRNNAEGKEIETNLYDVRPSSRPHSTPNLWEEREADEGRDNRKVEPTLVGRRKPRATFMMSSQVCVKKNARLKKGEIIENKSGNKAER